MNIREWRAAYWATAYDSHEDAVRSWARFLVAFGMSQSEAWHEALDFAKRHGYVPSTGGNRPIDRR